MTDNDQLQFERERLDFERQIRERELALREREAALREAELAEARQKREAEAADAAARYADESGKKAAENSFAARLGRAFIAILPLVVVLVPSYFGFVQATKSALLTAQYNAATEQYKARLELDQESQKRVNDALDAVTTNLTAFQSLFDSANGKFVVSGTMDNISYKHLRSQFYAIESSVSPLIDSSKLNDALKLYEQGLDYAEAKAQSQTDQAASLYSALNAAWLKTGNSKALPTEYDDLISLLTAYVSDKVSDERKNNTDPEKLSPVTKVFDNVMQGK